MSRAKKPPKDLADWHLWKEVTKSVRPLNPAKPPRLAVKPADPPTILDKSAKPDGRPNTKNWSPLLAHANQQAKHLPAYSFTPATPHPEKPMDQKLRRKIAKGRVGIDATIDLHGMRQHEARSALFHFVSTAFHRGNRNILVITGKGIKRTGFAEFEQKGVLRHAVPNWLKEPAMMHMVAGIDAAAQHHGGAGAIYVRLKRASA